MSLISQSSFEQLVKFADRHPRPLLFATVSGAHLYGFPSPDSDFDLRGVHVLPLEEIVGLNSGPETIESEFLEDGMEMDIVTHDAAKFFRLLLRPNGYVLEQLLSPLVVTRSASFEELQALAHGCITRHHVNHYRGFFHSQWRLFAKGEPPRLKPLLYAYRVLLTGIHLMRTGEVEANLHTLNLDFRIGYIDEFIDSKRRGNEKQPAAGIKVAFHEKECTRLLELMEQEAGRTHLPDAPSSGPALNDLLIRIRLGRR